MASLNTSAVNSTSIYWWVTGLSSNWDDDNYMKIALTSDSSGSNGSSSPPSGIISVMYPPSNGTSTSTSSTLSSGSYSGGNTYTLYGYAQSSNGLWYYVGSSTVTMPMDRPSDFSWSTSKSTGGSFNITASEWNSLCSKINEFRAYKSLGSYAFSTAYSGNNFLATMYNEARNAIYGMNPSTSIPPYRASGETIYATEINRLRDSLNSIS